MHRPDSVAKIDKFNNLTKIINEASGKDVFYGCDEEWWRAVATNIRNKSSHYLLPTLLRRCAAVPKLRKYIMEHHRPEKLDELHYEKYVTDWGSFYHKAGGYLAQGLLYDATEQIRVVINNTNWSGDKS